MQLTLFDRQFDIFTSGSDIKFIYHEDQIAQSLGQYDDNLSTNHFHVGYLLVGFAYFEDEFAQEVDQVWIWIDLDELYRFHILLDSFE